MTTVLQALPGRRKIALLGGLLLAGIIPGTPQSSVAHDLFTAYIQHSVILTAGAAKTDLELRLTFFEEWSAHERAVMDADADGRIARNEVESYVKELAPKLARQVKLRVAGKEIGLVPLYAPEVELLGNDRPGPAHHRLRLFFFAPAEVSWRAGDEIVIEDHLWPGAKALGTLDVEGHDGATLEAEKTSDPGFAPAREGEARLFKARCLRPPGAQPPDKPSGPASSARPE